MKTNEIESNGDESWSGRDTLPASHKEPFDEDIQTVGRLNRGRRGTVAGRRAGMTLTERVARGIATDTELAQWQAKQDF